MLIFHRIVDKVPHYRLISLNERSDVAMTTGAATVMEKKVGMIWNVGSCTYHQLWMDEHKHNNILEIRHREFLLGGVCVLYKYQQELCSLPNLQFGVCGNRPTSKVLNNVFCKLFFVNCSNYKDTLLPRQ